MPEPCLAKHIREVLENYLRQSGKNKQQLSQDLGIKPSSLSRILNSGAGISCEIIDKILNITGAKLNIIVPWSEEYTRTEELPVKKNHS